MNAVFSALRRARARLALVRLVGTLTLSVTAMLLGMFVLHALERLLGLQVDWGRAWLIAGASAVLAALVWAVAGVGPRARVARVLDERAGLRQSLSTALCVAGTDDPWSRATIEQAQALASTVKVREALPLELPRAWPGPFVAGALFLAAAMIPAMNLLAKPADADAERDLAQAQVAQAKAQEIEQQLEAVMAQPELPKGDGERGDSRQEEREVAETKDPKREAMKRLSDLKERVDELKRGPNQAALQQFREQLKDMKQLGAGPLSELNKAVQQGDFAQAQKEIENLLEKMDKGEMSEEQKQALAEQLQKLGEQLGNMAQQQSRLAEALRQAGMDPSLASNPEALQKALENASQLSPEQRQQLQQMAQASQKACEMAQKLSESACKAGQCMSQGEMGQCSGQMGQMASQLSELEMMAQQMAALDAADQQVQQQMAQLAGAGEGNKQGQWGQQFSQGQGQGPGIGAGANPDHRQDPAAQNNFATEKQRGNNEFVDGPIIGSMLVEGEQVRGESKAAFAKSVQAAVGEATDSIENKRVPREYEEIIKQYFGKFEKKAGSESPQPAPAGGDEAGGESEAEGGGE